MDDFNKQIGERIKLARKKRGLTQEELGEKIFVSRPTIIRWEKGEGCIEPVDFSRICNVLHCDVGFLFGEYDTFTRKQESIGERTGMDDDAVDILLKCKKFLDSGYLSYVDLYKELDFTNSFIKRRRSLATILDSLLRLKHNEKILKNYPYKHYLEEALEARIEEVVDIDEPHHQHIHTIEHDYYETLEGILEKNSIVLSSAEEDEIMDYANRFLYCRNNEEAQLRFEITQMFLSWIDDFVLEHIDDDVHTVIKVNYI